MAPRKKQYNKSKIKPDSNHSKKPLKINNNDNNVDHTTQNQNDNTNKVNTKVNILKKTPIINGTSTQQSKNGESSSIINDNKQATNENHIEYSPNYTQIKSNNPQNKDNIELKCQKIITNSMTSNTDNNIKNNSIIIDEKDNHKQVDLQVDLQVNSIQNSQILTSREHTSLSPPRNSPNSINNGYNNRTSNQNILYSSRESTETYENSYNEYPRIRSLCDISRILSNDQNSTNGARRRSASSRDSRWLQVEVCRDYRRGFCNRGSFGCQYAHPENVFSNNSRFVTACYDSMINKCFRRKCKYYHPPPHIQRNIKNMGRTIKNQRMMQTCNHQNETRSNRRNFRKRYKRLSRFTYSNSHIVDYNVNGNYPYQFNNHVMHDIYGSPIYPNYGYYYGHPQYDYWLFYNYHPNNIYSQPIYDDSFYDYNYEINNEYYNYNVYNNCPYGLYYIPTIDHYNYPTPSQYYNQNDANNVIYESSEEPLPDHADNLNYGPSTLIHDNTQNATSTVNGITRQLSKLSLNELNNDLDNPSQKLNNPSDNENSEKDFDNHSQNL